MNFDLTGKRVLVSAGGSGIGRAIVEGFVAQGAMVMTCDINPDFVDDLKIALPNVMAQVVDVGDEPAVQAFCPTLPVEEIDATDWNVCLNICLNSQFYFSKACIPSLRQSGDASITNLSSAAGKHGFAYRTPYAAAKWGVIGLTKSLAIELGADKIRVNAILPGLVAGDRQRNVLSAKAQRLGKSFDEVEQDAFSYTSIKDYVTAQDIADQIMYLASPSGRRISGQAIAVDGDTKMLA